MSSLLFLSHEDFDVSATAQGTALSSSISGLSVVLFYSTHCVYCQQLIPIFKNMPRVLSGCQFGMINVSVNKPILQKSKNTITPIEYVPLILMYLNGTPVMRYEGPHTKEDLKTFIIDMSKELQKQRTTSHSSGKKLPAYTLGEPLYGDDKRCYLEFHDAY